MSGNRKGRSAYLYPAEYQIVRDAATAERVYRLGAGSVSGILARGALEDARRVLAGEDIDSPEGLLNVDGDLQLCSVYMTDAEYGLVREAVALGDVSVARFFRRGGLREAQRVLTLVATQQR